ncbi:MAG: glycosyltransferase [Oscillospiraceae bacterium]|nr:glycosyltransferase [Oscillospiraceae bacterium]
MVPTYSIVIPVYNAEKYLESCIDSVLGQNAASSYEIILVNDGSSDRSPQICDRYAKHEACIKVIHQINQGVSAARNAGIAAASGTYILFLDADDYWDPRMLPVLEQAIQKEPDMVQFGWQEFNEYGVQCIELPSILTSGKTGGEFLEAHIAINTMPMVSCCAVAFRHRFLAENALLFPVGIRCGEDFDFLMNCFKHAKLVFSIGEPLYWYRMNETSVSHTMNFNQIRDAIFVCAKMYYLFPCAMLADYYCMNILHIAKLNKENADQLKHLLQEHRDILKDVSEKNMRIACVFYKIFGWYYASRLIQLGMKLRHAKKG